LKKRLRVFVPSRLHLFGVYNRSVQFRLARALWIAWAVVVWNVVFDQTIVFAGRRYIRAAIQAVGSHPRMDDFMRPAVTWGLWLSSASAGLILVTGWFLLARAKGDECA
jgi:hypothetical protein